MKIEEIKAQVREVMSEVIEPHMVDRNQFKATQRRLSWEESQEHYLALDEIEEKAWYGLDRKGKVSNGKRKKIEAKIHNDTNIYLREKGLIQNLGGFYRTEMSSPD